MFYNIFVICGTFFAMSLNGTIVSATEAINRALILAVAVASGLIGGMWFGIWVSRFVHQYVNLPKTERHKNKLIFFLLVITGVLGPNLGISLSKGFFTNIYLLLVTLGSGCLLAFLTLRPHLERKFKIAAYRKREEKLISLS